jgi:hypothetical protein
MHLDQLISYFSAGEVNYHPRFNELVQKQYHHRPNSRKAYILFPPWGQKLVFFTPLRYRILNNGFSCLEYQFSKAILTSDHLRVSQYIDYCLETIHKDLFHLKERRIDSFTIVGTSIGTMIALMVANTEPKVDKVILNSPGNCPAEIIWSSIRLKTMRQSLIRQGLSVQKLKRYWRDYLPENNLGNLKGKKIYLNLSRADRVVPYQSGRKLAEKMREQGLKPEVAENSNLGHYLTAAKYYLSPNFL